MRDKREKGWFWVENWLIDNEFLKPMERLLYMVLARHSDNDTSESFPSIETLCKKTGLKDKRTIVIHLKNLENFGLISIEKKLGKSNRYFLNNVPKEPVTKNDTSDKICITPVTKNDTTPVTKNVPLTRLSKNTKEKYSLNVCFDEFWKLYKKKIEKQKCLEKWNKLKDIDRDLIIKHIPVYEKSLSDIKYLKNPMTYLNSKMWLDDFEEIEIVTKKDNSLKTKEDDWSKTTWI